MSGSRVEAIVETQREKVRAEARKLLVQNAVDATFYVAGGRVLRHDLALKYGLTEDEVSGLLSVEAYKLVDHIRG